MEDKPTLLESLFEKVEDYGKTNIELIKLKAVDKTSDFVAALVAGLGLFTMAVVILVFLGIGGAIWIGEMMGNSYSGFLIMTGIYFLIALIYFFTMHAWVKKRIINSIIESCLNEDDCDIPEKK